MVRNEQADTSIWKIKAHLQESKERVTETTTRPSLISSPKNQPVNSLLPYGRDIPQALQDLSQLLPDVPTLEEDRQPEEPSIPPTEDPTSQIDNSSAQDPGKAQVDNHQQEGPSNDQPVAMVPSGHTQTGRQIRRLARFAYAAYHCKTMAQSGIQSVFDFHPFASL